AKLVLEYPAQQKTSEGKSGGPAIDSDSGIGEPGIGCLLRAKREITRCCIGAQDRVSLGAALAAKFVGVVAFDPGDADVGGRLELNAAALSGRWAHGAHAALTVASGKSVENRETSARGRSIVSPGDAEHSQDVEIRDRS